MYKLQLLAAAALAATVGACAHQTHTNAGLPLDTRTASADWAVAACALAGRWPRPATMTGTAWRIARARSSELTPPPPANLPDKSLDQELLFKFLLSEIAGQRGNLQLAAQGYLDMAKSTRDPRLAKRATEIANYARLPSIALEASRLWYDTDKGNPQARQALVSALLSNNKLQEAKPHLQAMLSADGDIAHGFLQLQSLLGKAGDKAAVLTITKDLAKELPADARGALRRGAGGLCRRASTSWPAAEAAEAMRLRPDWELGALLQAQMIQQKRLPGEGSRIPAKASSLLTRRRATCAPTMRAC